MHSEKHVLDGEMRHGPLAGVPLVFNLSSFRQCFGLCLRHDAPNSFHDCICNLSLDKGERRKNWFIYSYIRILTPQWELFPTHPLRALHPTHFLDCKCTIFMQLLSRNKFFMPRMVWHVSRLKLNLRLGMLPKHEAEIKCFCDSEMWPKFGVKIQFSQRFQNAYLHYIMHCVVHDSWNSLVNWTCIEAAICLLCHMQKLWIDSLRHFSLDMGTGQLWLYWGSAAIWRHREGRVEGECMGKAGRCSGVGESSSRCLDPNLVSGQPGLTQIENKAQVENKIKICFQSLAS